MDKSTREPSRLLDAIEQYAAAVEQDVRSKLRFTSYARRNSARDKRHLKQLAMRANLAERDAEVEALRVQLRVAQQQTRDALSLVECSKTVEAVSDALVRESEARAERLAGALREVLDCSSPIFTPAYNKARAALEQLQNNETSVPNWNKPNTES